VGLQDRPSWAEEIERLRRQPGPVGCENLSLCHWARKGHQQGRHLRTGLPIQIRSPHQHSGGRGRNYVRHRVHESLPASHIIRELIIAEASGNFNPLRRVDALGRKYDLSRLRIDGVREDRSRSTKNWSWR
jgi:hypothetical protein